MAQRRVAKLKGLRQKVFTEKINRLESRRGHSMSPRSKRMHICNMILTNAKQQFIIQWIEANQGALEEPVLDNGGTLMHVAVRQGQPQIAKALTENSNTMNS